MLINTGNISRKVLSKVLRSFDKNFERLHNLTGEMAAHYDVYYRVHAQTYGWLNWAKNGEAAGTAGLAKRLEGIQIVLVPKNGKAPATRYQGITSVRTQAYIKK